MSTQSANAAGRAPRTDIANIEQQLSAEASNIRATISAGGSPKISLDRAGRFTAPDGLDLGTEIRGVVIDYISANRYYTGAYDANNPAPPVCFAFGKVLNEMVPDSAAPEPQHSDCATCPLNQFGSRGKGKACKNTRELAFILEEDLENPDPTIYVVSVPPTALKSFDGFANLCSRVLNGPPIKAIVTIKAIPQGTYTTLSFTDPDENPHYATHFHLRDEASALIGQVPDLSNYQPSRPAPTPRQAAAARR